MLILQSCFIYIVILLLFCFIPVFDLFSVAANSSFLCSALNVAVETWFAKIVFLHLQAVDRHFKLPHASSKPLRSCSSMEDSTHKTLRFALRATLKTAIYRITTTFGDHLKYGLLLRITKGCKKYPNYSIFVSFLSH